MEREIKQEIEPIPDLEATHVASFGSKTNYLLVECVANFGNMMNYKNTPKNYTKISNGGISAVPFEYDFKNSKEYKLIYGQTLKIVLDGQEADKTHDNFDKVLDRNKAIFEFILKEILKRSDNVGFTVSDTLKDITEL